MVGKLRNDDALRRYVKSVRLRLYPFPTEEWTKESYADIKNRLAVNTEQWSRSNPSNQSYNIQDLAKRSPRSVEGCQEFVADAYMALFLQRCGWPDGLQWTQPLEPLLQQVMAQLGNLERVETAPVIGDPYLAPILTAEAVDYPRSMRFSAMQQWSATYADALALRTAPSSVRGIVLRNVMPALLSMEASGSYATSHAGDDRLVQDFHRRGHHVRELVVDSFTQYFYAGPAVLDIWRRGLRGLRHLTTLTLIEGGAAMPSHDVHDSRVQGKFDHKLEYLFTEALVLREVKILTLGRWTVPAALLAERTRSALPTLRLLNLQGIAFLSDDQRHGERVWHDFLNMLVDTGRITLRIQHPKIYDPTRYLMSPVALNKPARLALEARLEGQTSSE